MLFRTHMFWEPMMSSQGEDHVGLTKGICPTQVLSKITTLAQKKLQNSYIL